MQVQRTEKRLAIVSEETKQAREVWERWSWAEPSVWTERMLTALEKGVKGGKWFSLMDKVYAPRNLESAWRRVQVNGGAAGVDHESVEHFEKTVEKQLAKLHEQLRQGRYQPQAIRRTWAVLPKSGSCAGLSIRKAVKPPTGEPYAGEPHVRLGGRGSA